MTDITNSPAPIRVTLYRWAGQWGPFKIKVPCGECALIVDIIEDTMANELNGVPIELKADHLRGIHACSPHVVCSISCGK